MKAATLKPFVTFLKQDKSSATPYKLARVQTLYVLPVFEPQEGNPYTGN